MRTDETLRTKVIVRRLPPALSEERCKEILAEWLPLTNWFSYWPGNERYGACECTNLSLNNISIPSHYSSKSSKDSTFSRAYLGFKTPEGAVNFKNGFNVLAFRTEMDQITCASSIEYAPYARIPRRKGLQDSKVGTVEKNESYVAFKESLERGEGVIQLAEEEVKKSEENIQPTEGIVITALMKYLKERNLNSSAKSHARALKKERNATEKRFDSGSSSSNTAKIVDVAKGDVKNRNKKKKSNDRKLDKTKQMPPGLVLAPGVLPEAQRSSTQASVKVRLHSNSVKLLKRPSEMAEVERAKNSKEELTKTDLVAAAKETPAAEAQPPREHAERGRGRGRRPGRGRGRGRDGHRGRKGQTNSGQVDSQ